MTLSLNILKKADSVNQNNKGFTLLEMVVVMSIILMLAFLLYPATMRAVKKVEKIQCANNLKQLSYALTIYLQDYRMYPSSVRYAVSGEEGSIVDAVTDYINNKNEIFICPSTEDEFKFNELSYVYHEGIERNVTDDWLLVCARLPETPNPHLGDRANILWVDGHIEADVVEAPEEEDEME